MPRKKPGRSSTKASTSVKSGSVDSSGKKSSDAKVLAQYLKDLQIYSLDEEDKQNLPRLVKENIRPSMLTNLKEFIDYCYGYLSGKSKVRFSLCMASGCTIFADTFEDTLVEKAKDQLPTLAYRALADILIHEAQQGQTDRDSNATCEVGENLLLYLSGSACTSSERTTTQWGAFLHVLSAEELLCIFKHLIKIGVKQFVSNVQQRGDSLVIHFPVGLKFLLESTDSVYGLAQLLTDEVKQAKEKPGNFFFTTELGSLLSCNTVFQRDGENRSANTEGLLGAIRNKEAKLPRVMGSHYTKVKNDMPTMINALTNAFVHMLQSKSQNAALEWIAAVLDSNRSNHTEACTYEVCDAYMITFLQVLLQTWQTLSVNEQTVTDFRHYCSARFHCRGEKSLKGENVCNEICASAKPPKMIEELFLYCQRAIGVCFMSILRSPRCNKKAHQEDLDEANYLIASLDQNILTDANMHNIISQIYAKQCKFLLQEKILSSIPVFLIEDMTCWMIHVKKNTTVICSTCSLEDDLTDLSFQLLHYRDSIPTIPAAVAFALMNMLHIFAQSCRRETIVDRLVQSMDRFLPSLLLAYSFSCSDNYLSKMRNFIVLVLSKSWCSPVLENILPTQCKTNSFQSFLETFLTEFTKLNEKCVLGEMIGDDINIQLRECFQDNVSLLRKLTSHNLIFPLFFKHPVFPAMDSTISAIVEDLCDPQSYLNRDMELKRLNAINLEHLLDIVNMYSNETNGFVALSVDNENLNTLKTDKFFQDVQFPKLIILIEGTMKRRSQSQGTRMQPEDSWIAECLWTSLVEDDLLYTYWNHLKSVRFGSASLVHSHSLGGFFEDVKQNGEKYKMLAREMQRVERSLPFNLSGATFLVRDKERSDVLRCTMSGPVGTPYSRGLFVFDIYCAHNYPVACPMITLMSINGGDRALDLSERVQSLMSSEEAPHDQSGRSRDGIWSIMKVLRHLRTIMLSPPSHPDKHACKIRADTVRHAILKPLQNPPPGLERVVHLHFGVLRQAVLKQCARWVKECACNEELKADVLQLYLQMQALDVDGLNANRGSSETPH